MNGDATPVDNPSLTALYREAIRRHSAEPCGYGRSIDATHSHEEYNALCGDRVRVRLRVDSDSVTDAAFDGEACAICTASASLLCSLVPGEPVAKLRQLASNLSEALCSPVGGRLRPNGPSAASGLPEGSDIHLPEGLHPLLGVRPYPSRVRCATLPWEAAVAALDAD